MQLARRGFLRLISALPAFAVFRSSPVQAAPVTHHPKQTGVIVDIQAPNECLCSLSFSGKRLVCEYHRAQLDGPVVDSCAFGGRHIVITERSVYDIGPS